METLQKMDVGAQTNESKQSDADETDEESIDVEKVSVKDSYSKEESKFSCFVANVCSVKKIIVEWFAVKCKIMSTAENDQPFLFMRREAVKK